MTARSRVLSVFTLLAAAGAAFGIDVTRPGDLVTPSSPNHPAGEAAPFAIDNTARTKYLNFDELNTGFTVTATGKGVVRYVTIVTANDAPERDPTSFVLEGSDDGVNFTPIGTGALTPATDRFSISSSALFDNSTSYANYRITFPTVRNSAGANSMQVAEVQLTDRVDITSPDDSVTLTMPKGAFTGPNEGVNRLFDNRLGTKLDVQNANLGPVTVDVTPLAGSTVLNGMSYFSANDDAVFTGRTPQNVTIFGSNDGVNFTQVFTTPLVQASDNFQDQEFNFENTTAYAQYRIVFDVPFSSTDMQIGDFQLFGTANTEAPANDNCANATPVTAGMTSGTTNLASGTDITGCGDGDSVDVWYRYTAPASGLVEVNTCDSSTDTTLAVYSSCGGAAIACDDNGCGAQSLLTFNATANTTYFIRVALTDNQTGSFRLAIAENPEVHDDVALPLAYNFNGMTHTGEEEQPDNPDGYRSISDRGLIISGDNDSIGVGTLLGNTRIRYEIVQEAGVFDIVHLGDRNTTDNGNWAFDAVEDFDDVGIQPTWLPNTDQSGPQTTEFTDLNIVMTPETRIGVLYQISNGGGFFNWTLTFDDKSSATVLLEGPDWFFDQVPGPASFGVEAQAQLGVFRGGEAVDVGRFGSSLNVVEAITSTDRLLTDGFGDFTGRRLVSMSFSGRSNTVAGHAIIAASVRDADVSGACTADFNGDNQVNSQDFFDFLTAFFSELPSADFNDDGNINSQDFFDFLTAFFTGCD